MSTDHRRLNHDLGLFATDPLAGAGLPLWLPAGAVVRAELQRLAGELARADGCVDVFTPVLGKRALFERSGHWAKFADDMFPPIRLGGDELVLRPANCPHHALVYAAASPSYRELPIRLHEVAAMFRAERSGVLSGLSRVRQITLDDTHVFCRPDQVEAEAARGLRAALTAQRVLGLPVDHVRLSRRDDSNAWLGAADQWQAAEEQLRVAATAVLDDAGPSLVERRGEAAFYGPKLDLQVRDANGHAETIATVQLDFAQPERFDLQYTGADGRPHRPVMIHRGTVGSMERVVAALVEHYAGRLPFWLAPTQLVVLPVSAAEDDAARAVHDNALAAGLRSRLVAAGSLAARIRAAHQRRDHTVGVVGPREAAAGTVHLQQGDRRWTVPADQAVAQLAAAYHRREVNVAWGVRPT